MAMFGRISPNHVFSNRSVLKNTSEEDTFLCHESGAFAVASLGSGWPLYLTGCHRFSFVRSVTSGDDDEDGGSWTVLLPTKDDQQWIHL